MKNQNYRGDGVRKTTPLSQRNPREQLEHHVKAASSWLKAGAPEAAKEHLGKARAIVAANPKELGHMSSHLEAAHAAVAGPSPRSADVHVERAAKVLARKQASAAPRIDPKAARAASRKEAEGHRQEAYKHEAAAKEHDMKAMRLREQAPRGRDAQGRSVPQLSAAEKHEMGKHLMNAAEAHEKAGAAFRKAGSAEALGNQGGSAAGWGHTEHVQAQTHEERAASLRSQAESMGWDESKHPRDESGRFT